MPITTYRLPVEVTDRLDRIAAERGVSRTLVVREALAEYVSSRPERARSIVELADSLVTYRGSEGHGDLAERSEEHLRARLGSAGTRRGRRPR
jgi:hypothetical protein